MMTADQLLKLARIYAKATGLSLTTVGARAIKNNDKIFVRLEQGRGCSSRSIERAGKWFAVNWPDGVDWPADIPAPRDAAA